MVATGHFWGHEPNLGKKIKPNLEREKNQPTLERTNQAHPGKNQNTLGKKLNLLNGP